MSLLPTLLAAVAVSLTDADGRTLSDPSVGLLVTRTERDDMTTVRACVTSKAAGRRLIRLKARMPLEPDVTGIFDGLQVRVPEGVRTNALWREALPLTAAMRGRKGRAFAMDAEGYYPYVDFVSSARELVISCRVALLAPGQTYTAEFLDFGFDAKYDVRDAFARYYVRYPRLFKRRPGVSPAVFGPSAHYMSWRAADPERCRFMHAGWEWCIGAGRTWGDPLGNEQPVGAQNTRYAWDSEFRFHDRSRCQRRFRNEDVSCAEFRRIRDERLGFGYSCGVENAFYVMVLGNISKAIAERYPDSVAVGRTCTHGSYPQSTEVFTFPECGWGRETRRQLKELAETANLSAIGFDVARAKTEYRGERLKDMANVGWDEHGPSVPRGIANGKLLDDLRGVRTREGREVALIINSDTRYHMSDIFHADVMMAECAPWHHRKPFPLQDRLAMGEKGVTLWEGFRPNDFDAGFRRWSKTDQDRFINELARFAVHASFRTGASLTCGYMSGYTARLSQVWAALAAAGWKPVPGALADGEGWELARYGRGAESFLTVNNLQPAARTCKLSVFPFEIEKDRVGPEAQGMNGGFVYAPYFGGVARQSFAPDGETVSVEVGPQLSEVLECVATAEGTGVVTARWEGDFETLRLVIDRSRFKGTVACRQTVGSYRLAKEDATGAVYANTELKGVLEAVRGANAFGEIRHAPDADSTDQAARIAAFFRAADRRFTQDGPRLVPDRSLGAQTVSVAGFVLTADDRWKLAERVRRFLDVLNLERYPDYGPPVPMPVDVAAYYPLRRL